MSLTVSRVKNKSVINGSTFSRVLPDTCQGMKYTFLIVQIVFLSLKNVYKGLQNEMYHLEIHDPAFNTLSPWKL